LDALAIRIAKACAIKGTFTLRSGRIASEYFDKYQFESSPALLAETAQALAPLIPPDTDVLAGLEMGGVAIVTMLSHYSGLTAAFVRKSAKSYGTARLCEGADVEAKQVLIVEDVVTSGGQVVLSATALRELGARIDCALCVIDRQEGGAEALSSHGICLKALFRRIDLENGIR